MHPRRTKTPGLSTSERIRVHFRLRPVPMLPVGPPGRVDPRRPTSRRSRWCTRRAPPEHIAFGGRFGGSERNGPQGAGRWTGAEKRSGRWGRAILDSPRRHLYRSIVPNLVAHGIVYVYWQRTSESPYWAGPSDTFIHGQCLGSLRLLMGTNQLGSFV